MSGQTNHSTTPLYSEDEDLSLLFAEEKDFRRCGQYVISVSPYEGGRPFAISPVRRDE